MDPMTNESAPNTFEIFASYSHHDVATVKPMVELLRTAGPAVFRDENSIRPGKKWPVVVSTAIGGCRLMYLFWCSHSAASIEVRKEYEQALDLKKDIVPVLLDKTPLPPRLSEFQWIDLRDALGNHEETVRQTLSLEEGAIRQGLSREEHHVPRHGDAYTGGDFAREGWVQQGNQYVREVQLIRQPTDSAITEAAEQLRARLRQHIEI